MSRRYWIPVLVTLACLPDFPAEAQLLSDLAGLRHTYETQFLWADSLVSARQAEALRFLDLAERILALPGGMDTYRNRLLGEAGDLSDHLMVLDQEVEVATTMVRETRERLIPALESQAASLLRTAAGAEGSNREDMEARGRKLKAEAEALRKMQREVKAVGPLDSAEETLVALADVVAEEHERLQGQWIQQEELRLFLGTLRLFDEMSMPPSARAGGGDSQDPGCQPSACAIGGASPADVPVMHSRPEDPREGQGIGATTPESLARLHEMIAFHVEEDDISAGSLAQENPVVSREVVLGAGLMAFQGHGSTSSPSGPKVSTLLLWSRPLSGSIGFVLEPSVGARGLRDGSRTVSELAAEVRETVIGGVSDGRSRWFVSAWQKGRFLSKPLSPPGYLEPGRVETGVVGRFALPLDSRWQLEAEGGGDAVRYEPDDWRSLDRQGLSAAMGVGWYGALRSARLGLRASHQAFPHPLADWERGREDTQYSLEVSGSLDRTTLVRFSLVGAWNQSRIPAYDYRLGRAGLVLSFPWGKGSLQGYAAFAHQEYLNPGPEGARVAPSDQDSGSLVSLQYAYPLDSTRLILVRGGWSRSQTGFRSDFYDRFGISIDLTFRGR
jgi:hypothetical protein